MANINSPLVNPGNISQIIKNMVLGQSVYFELVDKETETVRRAMNSLKSYQPKMMKSLSLSLNHCIDINTHDVTLLIRVTCTSENHVKSECTTFPKKERKVKPPYQKKSRAEMKNAKLSDEDIVEIKKASDAGTKTPVLMEKYNVSYGTIRNAINKQTEAADAPL